MRRRLIVAAVVVPLLAATTAPAVEATRVDTDRLDLGPADLPEQRTTETVQPGVTLTRIVRGEPDPALFWTVEVSIPGGPGSPDPDAPPTALKDRVSAEETAAELAADGFDARVEQVTTPAVTDFAGGELGWRVRVGAFADRTAALAERGRLVAAGYAGSAVFTGWDSEPTDRGPWRVDVLTIDPRQFRGTLDMSYGPDLEQRETTSLLADAAGAVAGVNAGFFVLDPNAGAPGDPAGVSVDDGTLLSEPINGRPVLVFRDDARHSEVVRLTWTGEVVTASGDPMPLDGLNRVPGKIRNCGGTADDLPTS
ncbi:MAG: sporulation domain-containing protein, partial [Propionibacteriales bacterium]|nr:sporulation domain-containing protein [Propionibacteriales bacterium]